MLYYLASKFPAVSTRTFSIKPGWVLSKYMDPLIFVGFSIFSLTVPIIFEMNLMYNFYIIWLVLGHGHAICSVYPILFSIKRKTTNILIYPTLIIGCMVFSIALFNFNSDLLLFTLGISFMWHHTRQKIGWIHYSAKKTKSKRHLFDELIIYNTCLMPLLWRLMANNHNMTDPFLSAFTFPVQISLNLLSIPLYLDLKSFSIALFWGINILWIFKELKATLNTGAINPVKYYIILSGIICFSVSYAFFGSGMYWWAVNGLVHTASYTLFTYFFSNNQKRIIHSKSNKNYIKYIFLKNIFLYTTLVLIYGGITIGLSEYGKYSTSWWGFNFLWPLMNSLILLHYSIDAFIWKERFIGKILKT